MISSPFFPAARLISFSMGTEGKNGEGERGIQAHELLGKVPVISDVVNDDGDPGEVLPFSQGTFGTSFFSSGFFAGASFSPGSLG